jgi:hypothetical protein
MPNSSIRGQYIQFGAAWLFVNPNGGNLAASPQPIFPLTVQDVEVSIKGKIEELRGQYQYPDDSAVGDKDCTGKFSIGRKDWYLLNQAYSGDLVTPGGQTVSPNEVHSVPASSSYTITVAPPGTGTFVEDLGVIYHTGPNAGNRLQEQTASLTQAGQYQVSNVGVYTFDAADASASVLISYAYTLTTGNTYQINNQIMGYSPQCELFLVDSYQLVSGESNCLWLKSVKFHSMGNVGNRRDKYATPEVEFTAFANTSGQVLEAFVAAG